MTNEFQNYLTFENIYLSETKKNNGITEIQKTLYKMSQ